MSKSKSLQDQLLALGLASKKPQNKRHSPVRPSSRSATKKPAKQDVSLDQAYRIRAREERRQKQQIADQKQETERKRKEINQKIKAIIKSEAIRDKAADTKRNFLYKGRIRSVLATPEQVRAINSGTLGVVYLSGNYHLLKADRIEEIRLFAPDHVPDLQGAESEEEKDNPVPDDLIW